MSNQNREIQASYTLTQVAERLNLSKATVRKMANSGQLPGYRLNPLPGKERWTQWRFPVAAINQWETDRINETRNAA